MVDRAWSFNEQQQNKDLVYTHQCTPAKSQPILYWNQQDLSAIADEKEA